MIPSAQLLNAFFFYLFFFTTGHDGALYLPLMFRELEEPREQGQDALAMYS